MHQTTASPQKPGEHLTIDECVRLVTACTGFDDLKDTQPTYAPTFYVRTMTMTERAAAQRVASAFNAWAVRVGRARRAQVVS
jgi:hypothetical protein